MKLELSRKLENFMNLKMNTFLIFKITLNFKIGFLKFLKLLISNVTLPKVEYYPLFLYKN